MLQRATLLNTQTDGNAAQAAQQAVPQRGHAAPLLRATLPLGKMGGHQGRPLIPGDNLMLFSNDPAMKAKMEVPPSIRDRSPGFVLTIQSTIVNTQGRLFSNRKIALSRKAIG